MKKLRFVRALCVLAWPVGALADVTADDVLTNMLAPARAFGMEVSVAPVREGRTIYASNMEMRYALPLDIGEVRIKAGELVLDEQSDGSVTIRYREPYDMTVQIFTPEDGEVFTAVIDYTGFDTPTVARGVPGQITYEAVYDEARFEMNDVSVSGEAAFEMDLQGTFSGTNSFEITEGEIVDVVIAGETEMVRFTSQTRDPTGAMSTSDQTLTGGMTQMALSIPAGKVDLLNLHEAMAAGLRLSASTKEARLEGEGVTQAGEFTMRQTSSYVMESNDVTLSEEGLSLSGVYRDIAFEFLMPPELPFPIAGNAARSEGQMRLPLTQTDGAVPVEFKMTMEELQLDQAIWALFDPEARLPRDPMTLVMDLSGEAALLREPLDIARMIEVDVTQEPLGQLERLVLDDFLVQAVGLEITGSGAFEIDNSDYETFDGMPAPKGQVDLRVTGANRLLDTLVEMGLLPEEQAMGTRMMMGMFGTPGASEDEITSTIEVTEDGQVLANGQRLR